MQRHHPTHPHRLRAGLAAAAAIVLVAGGVGSTPVSAQGERVAFESVAGSFAAGDRTLAIADGSLVTGTWDEQTGAFEGELALIAPPTTTFEGREIDLRWPQLSEDDGTTVPATGTIDPGTGTVAIDVSLSFSFQVRIDGEQVAGPGCESTPVEVSLTGSHDAAAGTLRLEATGFAIPPAQGCGDQGDVLDRFLGGEPTSMVLDLVQVEDPAESDAPEDFPDTPEDVPVAPPPAGPVAGAPAYTG